MALTSSITQQLKKNIPVNFRRLILNKTIKQPLRAWLFDTVKNHLNLNMVSRDEILSNREKNHVLQFGTEESVLISEPCNNSDYLPSFIQSRINETVALERPFVCEVANAKLVGPAVVGFDEYGSMIAETIMPTTLKRIPESLKNGLPASTLILKSLPDIGISHLDTACSLVTCWNGNYHNWIAYCLTRIEGIEYYQEQTGIKPTIIIEPNPPKWKIESLRLLGYEPDDYMQWNKSRVQVKRLVVPSFRTRLQVPQPSACQWLRQRIFSNLPAASDKKFSPRVYISRPKKAGRNIVNEDALYEVLSSLGFVAYTPEYLSFSDQVRLFSQAEIVVAPHGAGLANIIFGNNLNVIELFSSYGTPAYFVLAKALGFRYGCLVSNPNVDVRKQYDQYKGMTVDVAKLRSLVEQMLEIPAAQTQQAIAQA